MFLDNAIIVAPISCITIPDPKIEDVLHINEFRTIWRNKYSETLKISKYSIYINNQNAAMP